jgi:hypothetical protein
VSEQPVEFQDEYLRKQLAGGKLEDMKLKPKANNMKLLVLFRMLAVITFLICLLVVAT